MITSPQNPHIKWLKRVWISKKFRTEQRCFLLENDAQLQELISQSPQKITKLYLNNSNQTYWTSLIKNTPIDIIADPVFANITSVTTTATAIAVIKQDWTPIEMPFSRAFYCDDLIIPANIGAIIRNAVAFGFDRIILSPACADVYHPESIRASAGLINYISISKALPSDIPENADTYILDMNGSIPISNLKTTLPAVFILGSEKGLSPTIRTANFKTLSIPIQKPAESLNVAVVSGIIGLKVSCI